MGWVLICLLPGLAFSAPFEGEFLCREARNAVITKLSPPGIMRLEIDTSLVFCVPQGWEAYQAYDKEEQWQRKNRKR